MERIPISPKTDPDTITVLNQMMDEALGQPIILDAAPTTAGGQVLEGQLAYYSNKLYLTINGTTYSINLTSV